MPVLDGFAATTKIRDMEKTGALRGRLPIIALTADVTGESEDRCRAAGMDHFLPKPLKLAGMSVLACLLACAVMTSGLVLSRS